MYEYVFLIDYSAFSVRFSVVSFIIWRVIYYNHNDIFCYYSKESVEIVISFHHQADMHHINLRT